LCGLAQREKDHIWIGHLNVSSPIVDGHYFRINALKEDHSFHFTDEYGFTVKPLQ
jgi:hypothetical protein